MLFHIMVQYLCLFSLILQDLHEEGECRHLGSRPERSKSEIPILHNSKSPEILQRIILEYINTIGSRKYRTGPTRWPKA